MFGEHLNAGVDHWRRPDDGLEGRPRVGARTPDGIDDQVARVKRVTASDKTRSIVAAATRTPANVILEWSDGTRAELDLKSLLRGKSFRALRDPAEFSRVRIGEWGHSLEWPSGVELGAEFLWLETLSATGRGDARRFLEWRLRHGLSLSKAADALGLSRRMVAYYSNGEKPVPKPILLACRGWEVSHAA
jgi:hypothetical protein